jgi:hypothetical protein
MLTPMKKPPHREPLDWEKEHNTEINKIRYVIGIGLYTRLTDRTT